MNGSQSTPVVDVRSLSYACGRAEAVRALNLCVRAGRCCGLFGRARRNKHGTVESGARSHTDP